MLTLKVLPNKNHFIDWCKGDVIVILRKPVPIRCLITNVEDSYFRVVVINETGDTILAKNKGLRFEKIPETTVVYLGSIEVNSCEM